MKRSDLPISSPCTANWDTMTRAGRKRFCSECSKHVHDLSALTADEAKALVEQKVGQDLCVRYAYDKLGNVLFATPPAQPLIALQSLLPSFRTAAIAVAATGAIAAYALSQQPQPRHENYIMGDTIRTEAVSPPEVKQPVVAAPEPEHYIIMGDMSSSPPDTQSKPAKPVKPTHREHSK
jgi:hypothetical protein